MKIALFGATGRVGSSVLNRALKEGHQIRALVRNPSSITADENLEIVVGDAKSKEAIEDTLKGCDAVFSALNTDKTTTLSESIVHIIEAMEQQNIKRIVTIGTAGILNSRVDINKLRYDSSEARQRSKVATKEHEKLYRVLQKTMLKWTIICPTALLNKEELGIYKYQKDFLPENGREISVLDTAAFSYEALLENLFIQHRVGIAY